MGAINRAPRLRLISSESLDEAASSGTQVAAPPAPVEAQDATAPEVNEDIELVARARRSEARAFETLYRRHAEFAFNLAARIHGSATDV
jgi:RNA polymerase sigma-70 factor (ECF subfamily)